MVRALAELTRIQRDIDRLMDFYAVGQPFVPFIKEALARKGVIRSAAATRPMPAATQAQQEALQTLLALAEEL